MGLTDGQTLSIQRPRQQRRVGRPRVETLAFEIENDPDGVNQVLIARHAGETAVISQLKADEPALFAPIEVIDAVVFDAHHNMLITLRVDAYTLDQLRRNSARAELVHRQPGVGSRLPRVESLPL